MLDDPPKLMCPNCLSLASDPSYPHSTLRWRMEEFDPISSEALGSKVFEECSLCGERWTHNRTRHKAALPPGAVA
ncbi:MAG: hypothetical protein ABSF50_07200 [Burkholderiaceae bacterium]